MTRYADFQPSPPYFITTSQIPASVQPGCVHVGNSVMTDTWQNLRFPHYGLRPQVLGLETLFTLSTSAFQVPKFCCCDLLFYTSQRCCFMAFEKQSHFYHCSRIWGGSGNVQISNGHLHPEAFFVKKTDEQGEGGDLRTLTENKCQQVCSLVFPYEQQGE